MSSVEQLAQVVGTAQACDALSVARATLYRRRRPAVQPRPRPRPKRALAPEERQNVLQVLRSERFVDKAPVQVYAELLDEGTYICSPRSMYRYLAAQSEIRERRNQLRHPVYTKPELLATAPNQVWSWDITKLKGPAKWTLFYLYVILDIFSRYVVGWMLSHAESAAQAKRLIGETCDKQGIVPGQLTIHADRGSSMRSQPVAGLMGKLGITKTHSRPHVSDDNPFSEAQFKTLKYCPWFPDRFGGFEDALAFGHRFFPHYNHEHRHSGIGLMTPFAVHYGLAPTITASRRETLLAAFTRTPERFVGGRPKPPVLPEKVWINPPREDTTLQDGSGPEIVTLTDPRVPPVFVSAGPTVLVPPTMPMGTLQQVQ